MRLSTIAALASAATVSASPIKKRQVGGVLLCTGVNATGTCKYQVYPLNQCQQLEKPFYQNTSTFAVDGEDFECNPRLVDCGGPICTSPTGCTLGAVDFNYKHKWNLDAGWDKYITSFDCHLKKTRK